MGVRRILNATEEVVYDRLRSACESDGAHVHPKMRLVDVVEVDKDPSQELRLFGLRSHLDFTVVDTSQMPLFAVEFDGPRHSSAAQRERDVKKDRICQSQQLPLLRITARHLVAYRGMDLLTWIVNVWFTQRAFDRAQSAGAIPWEEDFDPLSAMAFSDGKLSYPFWFAKPVHDTTRALQRAGRLLDPMPSVAIADVAGTYEGIAWLRISHEAAIYVTARMRDHDFPVNLADALEQVIEVELYEKLKQVLEGMCRPLPTAVVEAAVRKFQHRHEPCRASFVGGFPAASTNV